MFNVSGNTRYQRHGYVEAQKQLVTSVRDQITRMGASRLYANNVDSEENAPVPAKSLKPIAMAGI